MRLSNSPLAKAALLALVLVALPGGPAAAHGGEGPSLEVVPNRVEPGGTVAVLGEDLKPLSAVHVDLLTAAGDQRVIETTADAEGHFFESLVVPAELTARVYELRGTDAAGVSASTYITVLAAEQSSAETTLPRMAVAAVALAGLVVTALLALIVGRLVAGRRKSPRRLGR